MLVKPPKRFSVKLLCLPIVVAMLLSSAMLLVQSKPVKAVGTYDNASIADTALGYVGQSGTAACKDAGKSGGDQCKQFVNCIVWLASNKSQWPVDPNGNYQNSYSDVGGVEVHYSRTF